jgi:hypothetical protein
MYGAQPHRRRLVGRLIFLALFVVLAIAAFHLIAWALAPVLWIALVAGIVLLVVRRR